MDETNNECTHNCETCSQNCSSKAPQYDPQNQFSEIKKVIGVVSGKGGVGKSSVTAMLAVEAQRRGKKVAILDADVTGPSIPKLFGLSGLCNAAPLGGIEPMSTQSGIKVISVNLLMEDVTSPVVWRGPVIAGTVKQFWSETVWGSVDVMFIDCPPGTGDVPLTVFQSIKLDGIVIVTSPQELVSLIVTKAYNMASLMKIPVLGIIENMSYVKCPHCDEEIKLFGESGIDEFAKKLGIPVLGKLPINPSFAKLCDKGGAELADTSVIQTAADAVLS